MEQKGVRLTEEDIREIQFLIGCTAWGTFLAPNLKAFRSSRVTQLLDPSVDRKEKESDDFLRGQIDMIDFVLGMGQLQVDEFEKNAQAEAAMAQEDEQDIHARADLGSHGPL
jgi:hypothetical protein